MFSVWQVDAGMAWHPAICQGNLCDLLEILQVFGGGVVAAGA